jgi:hypothetical protein
MIENITEKVDTYEQEPKIKNCTNCGFSYLNNGKVECHRREAEGVVIEISEDQIYLECAARDVEVWDEDLNDEMIDNMLTEEYEDLLEERQEEYVKVMNDIFGGD